MITSASSHGGSRMSTYRESDRYNREDSRRGWPYSRPVHLTPVNSSHSATLRKAQPREIGFNYLEAQRKPQQLHQKQGSQQLWDYAPLHLKLKPQSGSPFPEQQKLPERGKALKVWIGGRWQTILYKGLVQGRGMRLALLTLQKIGSVLIKHALVVTYHVLGRKQAPSRWQICLNRAVEGHKWIFKIHHALFLSSSELELSRYGKRPDTSSNPGATS